MKRLDSASGLSRRRTLKPDDPRALGNLPDVPPPPTAEFVHAQLHRGDASVTELHKLLELCMLHRNNIYCVNVYFLSGSCMIYPEL